jgi:hypothetical protein
MSVKPFFSFEGLEEKLELYEDKLAIVPLRKTKSKEVDVKVIPYSAITSVIINQGNWLSNGFIKFKLFGGKNNLRGVLTALHGDEIIFTMVSNKASYERAVEITQFIEVQKLNQENRLGSRKSTFKF